MIRPTSSDPLCELSENTRCGYMNFMVRISSKVTPLNRVLCTRGSVSRMKTSTTGSSRHRVGGTPPRCLSRPGAPPVSYTEDSPRGQRLTSGHSSETTQSNLLMFPAHSVKSTTPFYSGCGHFFSSDTDILLFVYRNMGFDICSRETLPLGVLTGFAGWMITHEPPLQNTDTNFTSRTNPPVPPA